MATFSEMTVIAAPRRAVWQALADIGNIHVWNPGVIASRKTTECDVGVGAARYCDLGRKNYLEEDVVEWVPERVLTMRIVKTNMPFKAARIRFTLDGNDRQTRVTVSPSYRLKLGPLGVLLDAVMVRSQYRKGMAALLRGLKKHIESAAVNR